LELLFDGGPFGPLGCADLRIALLSESKEFGGAEQYLLLLADGVRALGHDVVLLLPAGARWRTKAAAGGRRLLECPAPPIAWGPLRQAWLWSTLRRLKPDVLHINLPSTYAASFSAGALAAALAGCPTVTTEHLSMIGRSRRRAVLKNAFTRYVCRVIAVSEATRRCLESEHGVAPAKIIVVLNGVDLKNIGLLAREEARARLGIERDAAVVGCVGDLIARKGHAHLIDAMAEVRHRFGEGVQLAVVGGGEERRDLEGRIGRLGLSGVVKLLGPIEGAATLLRAFDVFAMPSLMEAMPFALIEAMAAGLPAVATSVWGIPEVVIDGETGLIVPAGESHELAAAILRLLEDEGLRRRMGARAEEEARAKFSAESMAAKTVDVYRSLAARKD
jgi:glycosyltransferase involved in cell wall biosynthesis